MNRDRIIEEMARAIDEAIAVGGYNFDTVPVAQSALNASGLLERVEELENQVREQKYQNILDKKTPEQALDEYMKMQQNNTKAE